MDIKIYLPDLLSNNSCLCDNENRHDLLGQILYSLGHTVIPKQKLPSELLKSIPPFTCSCRGKIVDTAITLQFVSNSKLPPRKQVELGNQLLKHNNITLIPISDKDLQNNEDDLESAYQQMKIDNDDDSNDSDSDEYQIVTGLCLTNVARTSTYRCHGCESHMTLTELKVDDSKLVCSFCHDAIHNDEQLSVTTKFPDIINKLGIL